MTTHTSKEFESELRTLRERLCVMGRRSERQLQLAMQAVADRDGHVARAVIDADHQIDRDESEIDELAMQILATRQPVASDLRFITMSLKFVTDLERIGDLATGIARRTLELGRLPSLSCQPDLGQLSLLVQTNLGRVLESFTTRDADLATAVIRSDREIDHRTAVLFADLIARVAADPALVDRIIPWTSICWSLERIGDHVKNLGEEVVYMVRALDIRHRPREN